MTAQGGTYDFQAGVGETFQQTCRWLDPDREPIDLTGWSARMQVRPFRDSTTVFASVSTTDDGIVFDDDPGTFTITITDTVMDTMPPGTAFYDLEFIAPDGSVERLIRGRFIVRQQVTR